MTMTPQIAGRLSPIRLSDVPLKTRLQYARRLIDHAVLDGDLLLAAEIAGAAERPSDRIYWVPADQVRKVLGW